MTHFGRGRLAAWAVVVGVLAAGNYAARFVGSGPGTTGDRDALYTYGAAIGGLVFYAIFFAFVYAIAAVDTDDLFALRRPRSWSDAALVAIAIIFGVLAWEGIVSQLPLPQSPTAEQGITPTHWEPQHAGAYAANFAVIAVAAPLVEELTFRGVGFALLRDRYGRVAAIVLIGIAFGLAHGLIEGLLVLVPFGAGLAYLRDRTESTVPGIAVHFAFNAVALLSVVVR